MFFDCKLFARNFHFKRLCCLIQYFLYLGGYLLTTGQIYGFFAALPTVCSLLHINGKTPAFVSGAFLPLVLKWWVVGFPCYPKPKLLYSVLVTHTGILGTVVYAVGGFIQLFVNLGVGALYLVTHCSPPFRFFRLFFPRLLSRGLRRGISTRCISTLEPGNILPKNSTTSCTACTSFGTSNASGFLCSGQSPRTGQLSQSSFRTTSPGLSASFEPVPIVPPCGRFGEILHCFNCYFRQYVIRGIVKMRLQRITVDNLGNLFQKFFSFVHRFIDFWVCTLGTA